MITFTKKKIKLLAVIAAFAAATAAVCVGVIVTSVGTHAAERKLPIYSVDRGDMKVALTFDVAWENSNTDELIEILDNYGAEATFFVTGDWCDRYPDDVLKFHDAGHEIQNHSDQHPHVEGINVNELISDTKSCSAKIKQLTGEEPKLYRAPYGEYDDSLITTIEGMGMKAIQWDVEALDTDGKPLPEPIYMAWGSGWFFVRIVFAGHYILLRFLQAILIRVCCNFLPHSRMHTAQKRHRKVRLCCCLSLPAHS